MSGKHPKEQELAHFAALAPHWNDSSNALAPAVQALLALRFRNGESLLDVAAGTGVILAALQHLRLSPGRYLAVDISQPMLEELTRSYPEANTCCADFEAPQHFEDGFDCMLIYNSIPHFTNLEMLFENAERNLKPGGRFMIAHSRTRQGLREHHKRIGHKPAHEPIPADAELLRLAAKYRFAKAQCTDDDFFRFSCERLSR